MTRITLYVLIACAAALGIQPQGLLAQAYPAKPIRVVVPFGAGGPADIYARFLGQQMLGVLGQPFVVENRPGAGSIIGTDLVAKSAPDGYTLLVMSNTHTVNESLIPKKPFTLMKDFVAVAPINYSDLLLVVHPSVPAKSVKELVAARKEEPHELCVFRQRHAVPHGRRAVQGARGRGHPARTPQGQRRSAHQRHERAGRNDARCDHDDGAVAKAGQRPGAGNLRPHALERHAGPADDRGSGREGLRNHHLDRDHGAGRNTAGGRRAPERRDYQGHRAGPM